MVHWAQTSGLLESQRWLLGVDKLPGADFYPCGPHYRFLSDCGSLDADSKSLWVSLSIPGWHTISMGLTEGYQMTIGHYSQIPTPHGPQQWFLGVSGSLVADFQASLRVYGGLWVTGHRFSVSRGLTDVFQLCTGSGLLNF